MIPLIENIKSTLDNTAYSLVKFESSTCPSCKQLNPLLEEAEKVPIYNDVGFYIISLDDHYELAAEYNVRALPTLLFLRDGIMVAKHSGMITREELATYLSDLLES